MVRKLGTFGPKRIYANHAAEFSEFFAADDPRKLRADPELTQSNVVLTFRAAFASYGSGMLAEPTQCRSNSKDGVVTDSNRDGKQVKDEPQRQMGRGLRSLCGSQDTLHSQPVSGRPTM